MTNDELLGLLILLGLLLLLFGPMSCDEDENRGVEYALRRDLERVEGRLD